MRDGDPDGDPGGDSEGAAHMRWVAAADLGLLGVSSFTRKTLAVAGIGVQKGDSARKTA